MDAGAAAARGKAMNPSWGCGADGPAAVGRNYRNGDVTTVQPDGLRKRSFVIRYLTLFGGEAGSKVCVLLAFAYLARVLGPRDFGAIELALSMTIFFVLAAETGLGSLGARIVETEPHRAPELIARAGLLRAMLAVPAYAIVLALSVQRGTPVLALYGLTILLTPFNTQWVFQGLRQMQWVAAGSLARYGTFALLVLVLVRPGSDTRIVAAAEVSGALALALFNTVLLSRVLNIRLEWRGAWPGAIDLLRRAWFLGASDLTWAAMWYSPTIILGWIEPGRTEHVAWLAASVRIVMALHAFVWLYFFNLVPNLSRELHEGLDHWRDLIHRSLSFSMWPACFLAAAGTLAAPIAMVLLFGQAYERAVLPFQIVIWMIPVAWLSGHFRFSLIVSGHQRLEFLASAAAGLVTVIAAVLAGRAYGAPGAAAALLAGGGLNALISGVMMRAVIGPVRLTMAAPAVITCLTSLLIGVAGTWVLGRIGGAVLAGTVFACVTASQWDIARLKRAWEGRST
jgi:O-antigen/teichoic acid export membrane protein